MKITFRLKPGRDNDIIRWLKGLPEEPGRSFAIRQALRAHINGRAAAPTERAHIERKPLPPAEPEPVILADVAEPMQDDLAALESKLDSLF